MSTLYTYELTPALALRVRRPEHANSSGSVLLRSDNKTLWDCVECRQETVLRYTETDWAEKYRRLFKDDENNIDTLIAENEDEARFAYAAPIELVNANHCALSSGEPEVVHFAWDNVAGTLELQVVKTVDPHPLHVVGHTEYTSLLLRFEPVEFAADGSPKRRRICDDDA